MAADILAAAAVALVDTVAIMTLNILTMVMTMMMAQARVAPAVVVRVAVGGTVVMLLVEAAARQWKRISSRVEVAGRCGHRKAYPK